MAVCETLASFASKTNDACTSLFLIGKRWDTAMLSTLAFYMEPPEGSDLVMDGSFLCSGCI